MSTTNKEQLLKLLKGAEALIGSSGGPEKPQAKDVAQVLQRRLEAACVVLSDNFTVLSSDKLVLQKATADYVLCLLERMQSLLDVDVGAGGTQTLEFWLQIPARLIASPSDSPITWHARSGPDSDACAYHVQMGCGSAASPTLEG